MTLGKSFLLCGPSFPHLQVDRAASTHPAFPLTGWDLSKSSSSVMFSMLLFCSDFFALGWCFQIIRYWQSQTISPSFYRSICKASTKDKKGWGPDSLSLNQKVVVWKYPFRHKHCETKVETNLEKTKGRTSSNQTHCFIFCWNLFFPCHTAKSLGNV